eukprot:scaffold2663_cov353-Prasinococcus_capsulatus_cf.AAC.1
MVGPVVPSIAASHKVSALRESRRRRRPPSSRRRTTSGTQHARESLLTGARAAASDVTALAHVRTCATQAGDDGLAALDTTTKMRRAIGGVRPPLSASLAARFITVVVADVNTRRASRTQRPRQEQQEEAAGCSSGSQSAVRTGAPPLDAASADACEAAAGSCLAGVLHRTCRKVLCAPASSPNRPGARWWTDGWVHARASAETAAAGIKRRAGPTRARHFARAGEREEVAARVATRSPIASKAAGSRGGGSRSASQATSPPCCDARPRGSALGGAVRMDLQAGA